MSNPHFVDRQEHTSSDITPQERRLITLASHGLSSREIAEQVSFSESTVKKMLHRALRKLGATSRNHAIRVCLKKGIINVLDLAPLESLILCYVQLAPEKVMLTRRERQMLVLATQGLTNQEIAERMFVSVNAVKRCFSNIFAKLGARNKQAAIWIAQMRGFLNNLELLPAEEIADMIAASGKPIIQKYIALLEQRLAACAPDELSFDIAKLKSFCELLRQRLHTEQSPTAQAFAQASDTRIPAACETEAPPISVN